ncbi:MAG: serine hydrolase domain-containing protein [Verrucomicrobiota bacterium]|jgi:CubicO group peptidase (beta-lactamase class C family)
MKTLQTSRLFPGSLLFALLTLRLICLPVAAAEPAKTISRAVQPFVDSNTLAGAVMLVASSDKVLSLEAVGRMDIDQRKPMRTDALFWIASQSKPMTAAALMMLVDERRVNLDDRVEKYLPEFKGQMLTVEQDAEHVLLRKPAHPITVREILSHTSGLPFSSPMEQPTLDGLPLRDAVRSYAMVPLQFTPGTRYHYSNAGINTAGRIIEVVSGMPYEQFMEERLFKPLGMKDTTFWPSAKQVKRLAKSYKPVPGKTDLEETVVTQARYPLSDRVHRFPVPAGGLFSTASDTAQFCRMILNSGVCEGKRLLSEEAIRQLTTRQTAPDIKDSYGLGFAVGKDWSGHGGAYATNMQIDHRRGLVLVWMVQHKGFPGNGAESVNAFKNAAIAAFAP